MKILILGGTSFFGKETAKLFSEQGWDVTLFTRGNNLPTDLPKHKHINGDRNNLDDLIKAQKLGPWDVVIDNIAYKPEDTENALKVFTDTKHYIFVSTISVYRFSNNPFATPTKESDVNYHLKPHDENPNDIHWKYARGKLDAEKVVTENTKTPWTIFRPPMVYGPYDTSLRGFFYLARIVEGGPIVLQNGGANKLQLGFSLDMAKALKLCALNPKAFGKTYHAAQTEILTLKSFILDSAKALAKTTELISIPSDQIKKEEGGSYFFKHDLIFDSSKIKNDLGFEPTSWNKINSETVSWFLKNYSTFKKEVLKGRAEELQLLEAFSKAQKP